MNIPKINNIEDLLRLGTTKKIIKQEVRFLTAPGENYGSLMLSVDLTIKTPSGTEEIHAVMKMVPPNPFLQKIFDTENTFRNEIAFYEKIVPLLKKHAGKEIDFLPRFYGSRLNGGKVDEESALVLENLKIQNYGGLERTVGLDLDAAKLVLSNLAHLHALAIGFKLQCPEMFQEEIRPYLSGRILGAENHTWFKNDLICIIEQIDELKPLKDRILAGFDQQLVPYKCREPFATIVHNDCWTNNIMIKFEGVTPVKTKLVDFQLTFYGSPARDILFFLFTSVKSEVLKAHYDGLVKFYHGTFIEVLKGLNCNTKSFTLDALLTEFDLDAKSIEFSHIAYMLVPIFAEKKVTDVSEFKPEYLSEYVRNASELHKQKLIFVINEFMKRNWL